jgi:hypothetical protein
VLGPTGPGPATVSYPLVMLAGMDTASASAASKNGWNEAAWLDVEARLAEVCGYRNSFDARLVALTAEALDGGLWQGPGILSPSHWLGWKAGLSAGHARRIVSVAARRGEFPVTFAAFDAGELSLDQVAPICAKAPGYADAELCEFAKVATVTQLQRVLRTYRFDPDPVDGEDHTPDVPDRHTESLSLHHDEDGTWTLHARMDPDHGAIVDAALRETLDALVRAGCSLHPSLVDALVELAHRSLDTVADPARRDRFRVHLHINADRGDSCDRLGHGLPEWLRDLVCCDTTITTVIEHDGIPVSVGRSRYTVPERTRRLLVLRDRGCRVPGCSHDRHLHIHHIVHWDPDDGPTDTWNLLCLCPAHHRMHHRGQLGITGNADHPTGITFTDTHGRVLSPSAVARPPSGPAPPPAGRYRHPHGERLNPRWITFNPPPPRTTDTT